MPTTISLSRNRAIGLLLLVAGCSDPVKSDQCQDEDSPSVPGPPDSALLRARVTIENLVSIDAAGVRTVSNSIRADLIDTTSAVQLLRKPSTGNVGSPGCYGLTGNPVTECRPGVSPPCTLEKLDADTIEVLGLAGQAAVTLARSAKGAFNRDQLPDPIFASGPATVRITGRAEKGYFPSMDLQVTQPEPLVLKDPLATAVISYLTDARLGKPLGPGDIKVQWIPSTANLVAMIIDPYPASSGSTDELQCVLVDDGCTTLLHGDLETFDIKSGSQLKLQLIRDNTQVKTEGQTSLEVKVVSRVQLVLTR